jgi:glycosyltransferase involved in cell wall biosynthesis
MISIIVPVYNAASYLPACIDSLLAQTVQDIEVLLVDDLSTDDSLSIARSYASRDTRIRVIPQSHKGQSVARNTGFRQSNGEFVAFVDADDRIERDWCERHLAAIRGVDYVQSGYRRITPSAQVISTHSPLHQYRFTSPCMRLYRRDAIKHLAFAEGFIYEDVLFSADLWLSGAKTRVIRYAGYLYTLNPLSTTASSHPEDQQRLFKALREKGRKASLKGKGIILYTIIRLKLHFLQS